MVVFAPEFAEASTAGREKGKLATSLFHTGYTLVGGQGYTIETLNLSAGADTVLHVQDANGSHVDGNDDCATRNNSCSGLRSWLYLPPVSSARTVRIIVRAYSALSGGTATLRITPSSGNPTVLSVAFTAGYKKSLPSFQSSAHFLTVEEQGGSGDTILLVTSGHAGRAINFDDDQGVGMMSWVHVNEDCASGCNVIVGAYSPNSEGRTTFIWDEYIHVTDCDGDGLSDVLEASLGTLYCDADTDGDFLKDGEEVMGIDRASNLLRFPMYGADPLVKDLFVEVDWKECVPSRPGDFTCGDPQSPNHDRWQLPASEALTAASIFAPDVVLHLDTGLTNRDPATWFTYNNWSGAYRMSSKSANKCEWLHPDRAGFFHAARIEGLGSGQGLQPGRCFDSGTDARAFSHELGHNMNLAHGGSSLEPSL